MPKAVYRSGCHDKHNSNLHPLTLQLDALTTRPLRPAGSSYMFCELLFTNMPVDDDDDDDGRINFNVAYSPKTARTRNS